MVFHSTQKDSIIDWYTRHGSRCEAGGAQVALSVRARFPGAYPYSHSGWRFTPPPSDAATGTAGGSFDLHADIIGVPNDRSLGEALHVLVVR